MAEDISGGGGGKPRPQAGLAADGEGMREAADKRTQAGATDGGGDAGGLSGIDATALAGRPGGRDGVADLGTGRILSSDEREEREAVMGYDEQIAALKAAAAAVNRETPEQKKKRERQEKSRKMIAATVDGLSALSNLFFTTRYAPNAYNPQSSQLGKVNERIEALKAERQADADRYNNYMLRLGDAQNAKAKTIRDIRAQHEAQKLAREKAGRDAEAHRWQALLQPDKQREQKAKGDKAIFDAETSRHVMANKPTELELQNETERARKRSYDARSVASYASAENSRASARKHGKGYGTFDGRTYETKAEYEQAVMKAALEYRRRNKEKDLDNFSNAYTDLAAELEIRLAEERAAAGGGTNGAAAGGGFNKDDYRRGGASGTRPPLN